MAKACLKRLRGMDDDSLINAIATKPQDVSRQICLYAMMKEHRLTSDFMLPLDLDDGVKVNYTKLADVLATIK